MNKTIRNHLTLEHFYYLILIRIPAPPSKVKPHTRTHILLRVLRCDAKYQTFKRFHTNSKVVVVHHGIRIDRRKHFLSSL